MHKKISLRIILFFVLITSFTFAQTPTNLDKFYQLADSSLGLINFAGSSVCLKINNSGYSIFDNNLYKSAGTKGLTICKGSDNNFVSYSIEKAYVKYPLMFRDGFLGKFMCQRTVFLEGNYYLPSEGLKKFNISVSDTVAVDDIKNIENEAFPYTKGELPTEPFFSGLIEPIAAISTAAAIIVLYFTVRSK